MKAPTEAQRYNKRFGVYLRTINGKPFLWDEKSGWHVLGPMSVWDDAEVLA